MGCIFIESSMRFAGTVPTTRHKRIGGGIISAYATTAFIEPITSTTILMDAVQKLLSVSSVSRLIDFLHLPICGQTYKAPFCHHPHRTIAGHSYIIDFSMRNRVVFHLPYLVVGFVQIVKSGLCRHPYLTICSHRQGYNMIRPPIVRMSTITTEHVHLITIVSAQTVLGCIPHIFLTIFHYVMQIG